MSPLDNLCRFCSQELDPSSSKNIFDPKNSHLLTTALLCIPVPMSADDRYPKHACFHCAFKLNILSEFHDVGLSSIAVFDDILSKEECNMTVFDPVNIKVEISSDTECFEDDGMKCQDKKVTSTSMKQKKVESDGLKRSLTDTKERQIQCELCQKSFTRRTHLVRHMRCHSGEKPSQCKICEKCFAREEHLNRHMFSHLRLLTGERPFLCEVCNNTYTRKDHLNRHKRKKRHGSTDCEFVS